MTWTDEQQQHLKEAYGAAFASDPGGAAAGVLAVADLAISLFLARASGQVKEDRDRVAHVLAQSASQLGYAPGNVVEAVTQNAQAALSRLCALAQERDTLRSELKGAEEKAALHLRNAQRADKDVVALRAEVERLKARKWVQCTSVSNECLGGCASMAEHDRYRQRELLHEVENLRPLVVPITLKNGAQVTPDGAPDMDAARRMFEAERAKVAERVRQKSAEVMAMAGGVPAREPDPGRANPKDWESYERGAEAMRAACLTVALEWARAQGYIDGSETLADLKARIEGATP